MTRRVKTRPTTLIRIYVADHLALRARAGHRPAAGQAPGAVSARAGHAHLRPAHAGGAAAAGLAENLPSAEDRGAGKPAQDWLVHHGRQSMQPSGCAVTALPA